MTSAPDTADVPAPCGPRDLQAASRQAASVRRWRRSVRTVRQTCRAATVVSHPLRFSTPLVSARLSFRLLDRVIGLGHGTEHPVDNARAGGGGLPRTGRPEICFPPSV